MKPLTPKQAATLDRLAELCAGSPELARRTLDYLDNPDNPDPEKPMSGDATMTRIPGPLSRRAQVLVPMARRYPELLGMAHTARITRSTVIREALALGLSALEKRYSEIRRRGEDRRILAARDDAGERGDPDAIRLCDRAIAGDPEARREVLAELDMQAAADTCQSGKITGQRCMGDPVIVVEHVPVYLRASHEAAGNRGVYPHNGAVRLRVCEDCRGWLLAEPGEWSREVGARPQRPR